MKLLRRTFLVGSMASLALMATAQAKLEGHRLIAQDRGKIVILSPTGEVEWEIENRHNAHDISALPNGNFLIHPQQDTVAEITRDKNIVWKYQAKPKEGYNGRVEVHAFQRLKNGNTMVAETGNLRIVEVDKDAKIVKEVPIMVDRQDSHRDTRMVRKLDNGNYLVCHEGDGMVREYDDTGKVVWSFKIDLNGRPRTPGHEGHGTEVFGAIRLKNGNTLIAGGNNNRVIEVSPGGKVVWSVEHNELPGIELHWVTTLQVLPNGHIVIGNTHAGPNNPQLIEITRDKKVVWTLKDFKTLGNDLCAAQLLDIKGPVIR